MVHSSRHGKIHTAQKPKAEDHNFGRRNDILSFKLLLVVCTRGSDVVDREEVGQGEIRACQLGREVVGQYMYRGGEWLAGGCLPFWPFPPEAKADN